MTNGMIGADPAALRALAQTMSTSSSALTTIDQQITVVLANTGWQGQDAQRFRSNWNTSMRARLQDSATMLRDRSTTLLADADEQDTASDEGGGGLGGSSGGPGGGGMPGQPGGPGLGQPGGPSNPADDRSWGDAFTDEDYEHAPTGIEWLFDRFDEKIADGWQPFQWVAEKFGWNFEFVQRGMDPVVDAIKTGSKALGWLGGAIGIGDIATGIAHKDPFRTADGAIGAGLSIAALAATGTIVGAPAGLVLGGAALVWGLAGLASGDVPVTKRIFDAGKWAVGGISDAADSVADAGSDLVDKGKGLVSGAKGLLGFG